MARSEDHPDFGLGLEWLVAAIPEALLIVGAKGIIEHANLSAAHLFGYSLDELVGAKIETLVPTRLRAEHVRVRMDFDRAPHDRPMGGKLEIMALRRDGSEFPVDIELRPRRAPEGAMTITVVRERDGAAPRKNVGGGAARPVAESAEIRQILAQSRPLLAKVGTHLAEVLTNAETRHREGRLVDGAFVEIRRLVTSTRSNVMDLLCFIEAETGSSDHSL